MANRRVLHMVWIDVDPNVEEEWNRWLDETHVPEVIEKGKFLGARRFVVRDGNGPGKYVNVYEARDEETLRRYIEGPGKLLREDYQKHYGKTSKLTRIVVEELPPRTR